MTGMDRGVSDVNPIVVSSFHSSLASQLLVVFALAVALALAWTALYAVQRQRAITAGEGGTPTIRPSAVVDREPIARQVLRIGLGVLWVIDGLLQLQSAMPLGLPQGVLAPTADGAPHWVHEVVGFAVTTWSNHPVSAAAATVWVQLGLGLGLLVAPRGRWSQAAGAAAAGWGLVVWVFGEAFGGLFTPGASWLFGLPGAALLYVVAGVLVALPESSWQGRALGRWLLRGLGALFIASGVLQAWPGRGTWAGHATTHAAPGLTAAMAAQMAAVSQPGVTAAMVRWFSRVDAAHGWGINLVVVVSLVGLGSLLAVGTRRAVAIGVGGGLVLCAATWVLVQDLGVFGGMGTDPNSMVPTALLLVVGFLALRPARAASSEPATADAVRSSSLATYLLRVVGAVGAAGIVLLGAAPMAVASASSSADPILAEAVNGTPVRPADLPAWGFTLTDQSGRPVSLRALQGDVVVLTFLDPVCTTDCPLLAQQLAHVGRSFGASHPPVVVVAVDANPSYRSRAALVAFDRQERLTSMRNWHFVTGPLAELTRLWNDYGIEVGTSSAGGMSAHNDLVFVIGPTGRIRSVIQADPGPSAATASSLATLVAGEVHRVLAT
jgi:cytochrome oxidase Cu insertion factor (SCO1/SenC/PrrC family)